MEPEPLPIDKVEPRPFRPVLEAWYRQRGSGADCPGRAEMQPFVVPSLAAHAVLFGVTDEDFIYRLVGEKIRQVVKTRLKGRSVRDVLGETDYYRFVVAQFHLVIARRVPLYSVHRLRRPDDDLLVAAWRIVLPYREGDIVSRLLTYQLYDMSVPAGSQAEMREMREMRPRNLFWVTPPPR